MKKLGFILAAALAAIFLPLYIHQLHKINEAETTTANLRQQVTDLENRAAEQQTRAETLQTRLHDTRETAVAKADQVSELQQALTNTIQTNAKSASPMAEMLKSPEMQKMIKSQQELVLNSLIDKTYAPFVSGLGASPEQSASLKDLLTKRSLVDAQLGLSLMAGDMDGAKRAELLQQAKTEKDSFNDQIKQLLGDDSYAQFQAYEKTVPQRMSLSMFKDQQAAGPAALTPDQETQLITAVTEETQNFKFSTDFSDQSKIMADPGSFFTDEKMAQFDQEREQLYERYLERATNILSPVQLGPFAKFLDSQGTMQANGLKMAAKLFGAKQ
jgi:Tfp pilus assembly protein PilE